MTRVCFIPDIGNQKPGFSLAKVLFVLQNPQEAAIRLVQTTKNLVSLSVSGSERVCFISVEDGLVTAGTEIEGMIEGRVRKLLTFVVKL